MFKRIIKDERMFGSKDISTVKPDKTIIHPITLNTINTSGFINPVCLTKMYISNNKLNEFDNYICNGENKYKEYIQLPPISLNSQDLLEIYNINNIENLKDWVENNLTTYNEITLSRVLTCWITNNVDTLKLYRKYFHEIFFNIFYQHSNIRKHLRYEDDIKKYINEWIDNYKIDQDNDFYRDIFKYIINLVK